MSDSVEMARLRQLVGRLAANLTSVQREVRALKTAPQTGYSAIDAGALTVTDAEGNVRQLLGAQPDGTYTITDVNAPPPPVPPSAPTLDATKPGVLVVAWDGGTADGSPWLADWDRVEVHVDAVAGAEPTDLNQVHAFTSPAGGAVTLALDPGTYYVTLTAANRSGAESGASVESSGTVTPAASGGDEPTDPPASSPAVEIHGTADGLVLEVQEEFAATTTLDFHISTAPDFEPTAATLSGSARSAVFIIVNLPDRSRLAPETTYYVRVVARNNVGAAPAGPVASGSLDPSVVSELVAAKLVAGFVLAGAIQVGNITIDPANGIVVPLSNGGVIHIPADGTAATVDAHINARSLNVENDLAIDGYGELGGELQLRTGISNPLIAPTITSGWPSYAIPPVEDNLTAHMGVWVDPATGEGRIAFLSRWSNTDGYDLEVYRTSDRSLVQTIDLPFTRALTSTQHITDFKVERGLDAGDNNVYLYVLVGDYASGTSSPVTLRKYTFGNFTTATTTRNNVAGTTDVACLAPMGEELYVVYNVWEQGVYVKGFNARSSTFAPLPGTWPIRLSTSNLQPRAAAANVWPSELYLTFEERDGTIFCWQHADDMDPNTPPGGELPDINHTFTQATSRNMATAFPNTSPFAMATLGDGHLYTWYYGDNRFVIHRAPYQDPVANKAGYTWYDPDASGGTHETMLSPLTTYTTARGAWPAMSVPKPPEADITDPTRVDKATHVGIYIGNASLANSQLPRHSYRASADRNLGVGTFYPQGTGSTNYPPATNQFLTSQSPPGRILSAAMDAALAPLIDLKGDGAWRLGSISGNAAGVVSGAGRVQAGVSTYRATATSGAPGVRLGTEATPTVWSNSILRGFTYNSANGTWTCQAGAGGTYLVFAKATWAADTAADWGCGLQIWKNDAQMGGINDIWPHLKVLGNSTGPVCVTAIEIAVGDRMQMSIWQNSGAAKTPNGVQFYLIPLLS